MCITSIEIQPQLGILMWVNDDYDNTRFKNVWASAF